MTWSSWKNSTTTSIPGHEQAIVNPDWLDSLQDSDTEADRSGLGALFGIDEEGEEEAPSTATSDLDDLLADDEIENLFNELIAEDSNDGAPLTDDDEAPGCHRVPGRTGIHCHGSRRHRRG